MRQKLTKLVMSSIVIGVIAVGVPLAANAAKHKPHTVNAALVKTHRSANGNSSETPLTGTTLTSATTAALAAVPGGTVTSATTETDGTGAYEVVVTKTDGSRVKVVEDASFKVLSTTATSCP